jgi:hypothetical protein
MSVLGKDGRGEEMELVFGDGGWLVISLAREGKYHRNSHGHSLHSSLLSLFPLRQKVQILRIADFSFFPPSLPSSSSFFILF